MKVRVSNIAFSKNSYLTDLLQQEFPGSLINDSAVRMNDDDLIEFFFDAEAVIVGLEKIDPHLLDRLPSLRMIAKFGVGLDNIDIKACKERNISVGWTSGVNRRSVAEMVIGFMITLCRNLYVTSNQLKELKWNKSGGVQLTGKTIGIIGLGNIGKEVVQLLAPFKCKILVNDILDISDYAAKNNLETCSLNRLFIESDFISIHTPLTESTRNLINLDVLKSMKSNAFLINTARGGIVNESDLIFALRNEIIAGAALDVYDPEPPTSKELLCIPNLICTPHTGGNSYEAVVAMGLSAIEHLINSDQNK